MRRVIGIAALLCLAATAHADGLTGHWSGTWTKANDPLPVTVTFEKTREAFAGSFDSDALQVAGIPFRDVTENEGKVRFILQGDRTTAVFDGALAGEALAGTFDEAGVRGAFALTRTPAPPALAKRDVTFANADVTLAGELVLPSSAGKHPAILILHGSGAEGRWASRYLAQKFARAGFVALIFDKRGVGASIGDWREADFEELAADAVAGLRLLASLPEVDPKRVGIYGHSQGGTIAPLVAERAQTLAFVIAAAASGLDLAETEIYSIENSIGVRDLPPAEQQDAKRFVREIVDVAYKGKDRDRLDAMMKTYRGRSWFFEPPPPEHHYWRFSHRIANYRPLDHWRNVGARVLIVFGKHDQRVPARRSMLAISEARSAAGKPTDLSLYDNAGHAFDIVPRSPPDGWPKRVPDYADKLIRWADES